MTFKENLGKAPLSVPQALCRLILENVATDKSKEIKHFLSENQDALIKDLRSTRPLDVQNILKNKSISIMVKDFTVLGFAIICGTRVELLRDLKVALNIDLNQEELLVESGKPVKLCVLFQDFSFLNKNFSDNSYHMGVANFLNSNGYDFSFKDKPNFLSIYEGTKGEVGDHDLASHIKTWIEKRKIVKAKPKDQNLTKNKYSRHC